MPAPYCVSRQSAAGSEGRGWTNEAYTDLVCRVAPEHGAKCADFLHEFNGKDGTADAAALLGPDHLHPSLAGRQRIADMLMGLGLAPLR